jgi:hypothetical protein
MSKGKIIIYCLEEGPKPRNPFALHAKRRRAATFKDRREARGGARNKQRDYKEEE